MCFLVRGACRDNRDGWRPSKAEGDYKMRHWVSGTLAIIMALLGPLIVCCIVFLAIPLGDPTKSFGDSWVCH